MRNTTVRPTLAGRILTDIAGTLGVVVLFGSAFAWAGVFAAVLP